jgi:hypothetical protein
VWTGNIRYNKALLDVSSCHALVPMYCILPAPGPVSWGPGIAKVDKALDKSPFMLDSVLNTPL